MMWMKVCIVLLSCAVLSHGDCGGTVTGTEGTISSPGYPASYPGNLHCTWTLPSRGGSLTLTFSDFQLERPFGLFASQCNYDYVEVLDGDSLVGRWCGEDNPGTFTFERRTARVRLVSDPSISRRGFSLQWTLDGVAPPCGGVMDGTFGEITTPRYPLNYPSSQTCTWTIPAQGGQIIARFLDFVLEKGNSCQYDYLEIAIGDEAPRRHCGDDFPPEITSYSDVTLHFVSDANKEEKGFQLFYSIQPVSNGGAAGGDSDSPHTPSPTADADQS
ncbi:PREDICTED: CUB domain-containing protein 2-like [Branchiostoma belcheri]|uniref:CUB domain-containing protein 2-like n=1 Tax=Branchiostoma belcheri TaxID=7741 RepID=A0A6P4XIJ9_BRABE|nr:PREDICTED: CUB domain-containing protein 2-like [Branchiostoma belcheri]